MQRQLRWQEMRMAELERRHPDEVLVRLRRIVELPKAAQHFRKHGLEFQPLGAQSEQEYLALFLQHISRNDLRLFSYIRPENEERMWLLVGMDNGIVAQYNETRGTYWSFFRHADVFRYLKSGVGWWVEIDGGLVRRWK